MLTKKKKLLKKEQINEDWSIIKVNIEIVKKQFIDLKN
jgi:sulfur carrier protein ThiS